MKTAVLYALAALLLLLALPAAPMAAPRPVISVLADESLTLPLSEITRRFSRQKRISIICTFAPPLTNVHTIDEGEPADLLITAYSGLMDQLRRKGLVDVYSQRSVAGARLTFVRSAEGGVPPSGIRTSGPILIPAPTLNSEGRVAEAYVESLKAQPIYTASASLLARELKKTGGAGMTYSTELKRLPGLLPHSFADVETPPPVVMFEGIVVAGENMDASRLLMSYLGSAEAKQIFSKYGFTAD